MLFQQVTAALMFKRIDRQVSDNKISKRNNSQNYGCCTGVQKRPFMVFFCDIGFYFIT